MCGHGALAHRLHDGTVEVARLIRTDELLADQVAADLGYGGSLRRYLSLCQRTHLQPMALAQTADGHPPTTGPPDRPAPARQRGERAPLT